MPETAKSLYNQWAQSGSLRPNMLLTDRSEDMLRRLQDALYDELQPTSPDIRKVKDLHATTFYLRPAELFKYMKRSVNPKVTQEQFYPHLMSPTSLLLMHHEPTRVETTGIEHFGSDHTSVGVALNARHFEFASMLVKKEILHSLEVFGATDETFADMATIPQFEWLVKDATPHVSLLNGLAPHASLPELYAPRSLVFDGVDVGSATFSPSDPNVLHSWHLRGLPGDPLLDEPDHRDKRVRYVS